jgi:UDP-N-acetylglucosamine:LPS N-acetylglucosamine transferase
VARLVEEAGAGRVVDSSDPDSFPREVTRLLAATDEIRQRAAASADFAAQHFAQRQFGRHFDGLLRDVVRRSESRLWRP